MKPAGMSTWLVEDAYIAEEELRKHLPDAPADLKQHLARGAKPFAVVWLIVIGPKRLWCAFCRGNEKAEMTPVGALTLHALTNLPALPSPKPALNLAYISGPSRFEPMVTRVLSDADDKSLVAFLGDMQGALDGPVFLYMQPQGRVKAAVELTAGGWPVRWIPL